MISQEQLIVSLALAPVMLVGFLATSGLYTFYERKVSAWMQNRYGPNRTGPKGYFQFMADGTKFFTKEDIIPAYVDRPIYLLAPMAIMVPALILFAVIPFGMPFYWNGSIINLQIADMGIGVLYLIAVAGMGIYGIVLGAWASNSKYPLFGGIRASAQMVSYALAMGLSIIAVVLIAGSASANSFSLTYIIERQTEYWFGIIPKWNVFASPVAFVIFLICTFAESNRLPFDFAEAEQELVGGYHTEYSSMKFAMFMLSEYVNMITLSMLIVVLFFGGWHVPGIEAIPSAWIAVPISVLAFLLKTAFFMFLFLWIRWTLPRLRYDQLMGLSWKVLLPVALANVLVTALWIAIFA